MRSNPLTRLWGHSGRSRPIIRAAVLQAGLLAGAVMLAALIAWPFGLGISALGVLSLYTLLAVAATAWSMRGEVEEEDEEARALADFAVQPLGALIADSKDQLVSARRSVGRDAAMYRPLDRLVRATRKIERRLALDPALRPHLNRILTQQMPLIATTAGQYARLQGQSLTGEQAERMIVAEGVLREAGDRLDDLARADGKPDGATIGLIRMDANAEMLAERMSADMDAVTLRAAALRGVHALLQGAKSADERLASQMRGGADRIERLAVEDSPLLRRFVETEIPGLIASAEAVAGEADGEAEERLLGHLRRLVQMESEAVSGAK